jgi:hypothetical protein
MKIKRHLRMELRGCIMSSERNDLVDGANDDADDLLVVSDKRWMVF